MNIQGVEYSYYIRRKYYNKPLGKGPIQEVYSGTAFYDNIGKPIVITNNKVTFNARVCLKTVKVTRQGYRQGRPQPGNKGLSSHIWWQSGGCFSV